MIDKGYLEIMDWLDHGDQVISSNFSVGESISQFKVEMRSDYTTPPVISN